MFKYYKKNAIFFGGSYYFRIENERKEYFYILIKEPNNLSKWMLGEKYCVIEDAATPPILCQILELSNLKSLTADFWNKNLKKFPLSLVKFIKKDLQFEVGKAPVEEYNFERIRRTFDERKYQGMKDQRTHKRMQDDGSDNSGGYQYSSEPSVPSTDLGSSWLDDYSSSDDGSSSSSFDFGGGDSGGGGAGGDY